MCSVTYSTQLSMCSCVFYEPRWVCERGLCACVCVCVPPLSSKEVSLSVSVPLSFVRKGSERRGCVEDRWRACGVVQQTQREDDGGR